MTDPVLKGNKCLSCQGEGSIAGDFCHVCLGTGYRESIAEKIFSKRIYDDIVAKCDAVIAEQASQRAALTAVLTQIWNKVKDL